jgi:hypothetical protein
MLKGSTLKASLLVSGFDELLEMDTIGHKTVPLRIELPGVVIFASFNPKSFRKAQKTYKEFLPLGEQINVSLTGTFNFATRILEAAGIQIMQKKAKEKVESPVAEGAVEGEGDGDASAAPAKISIGEPAADGVAVEQTSSETVTAEGASEESKEEKEAKAEKQQQKSSKNNKNNKFNKFNKFNKNKNHKPKKPAGDPSAAQSEESQSEEASSVSDSIDSNESNDIHVEDSSSSSSSAVSAPEMAVQEVVVVNTPVVPEIAHSSPPVDVPVVATPAVPSATESV